MRIVFVRRDGVDNTAYGVRAVEQRRRAFDHFEPLKIHTVDRLAVVARLRRRRSAACPVLQNQNTIAVKPADDGPRRSRAERSFADAGFTFQNFTDGRARLLGDPRPADRVDRLERIEDRFFLARRRHVHLLAKGSQTHRKVYGRRLSSRQIYNANLVGKPLDMDCNVITARRQLPKFEAPGIVGLNCPVTLRDLHRRSGNGLAIGLTRHRSADRAGRLSKRRKSKKKKYRRNNNKLVHVFNLKNLKNSFAISLRPLRLCGKSNFTRSRKGRKEKTKAVGTTNSGSLGGSCLVRF